MFFKATQTITETVIEFLRDFFKTYIPVGANDYFVNVPKFRYADDYRQTKIYIFNQFYEEDEYYPCIIVTDIAGDSTEIGFQQRLGQSVDYSTDSVSFLFGGFFDFKLTLELVCKSMLDLKMLADIVLGLLVYKFRTDLLKLDIHPIPIRHISVSSIGVINRTSMDTQLYTLSIVYPIQVEWHEEILKEGIVLQNIEFIPYPEVGPIFADNFDRYLNNAIPEFWDILNFKLNSGVILDDLLSKVFVKENMLFIGIPSGMPNFCGKAALISNYILKQASEFRVDLRSQQFDKTYSFLFGILIYKNNANYFIIGCVYESIAQTNMWYWGKMDNGIWFETSFILAKDWEPGVWYESIVRNTGTKIEFFINSKKVLEQAYVISDYKVGLFAASNSAVLDPKAYFDNIVLFELR